MCGVTSLLAPTGVSTNMQTRSSVTYLPQVELVKMLRKSLVLALKGMVVRGEIRTAVEYLVQLLETEDFKANSIDTSWLDGIIKAKSIAMKEDPHSIVASAVLYRAFKMVKK